MACPPDTERHQKEVRGDEEHPEQEKPEHLLSVIALDIHLGALPSMFYLASIAPRAGAD